MPEAVGAFTGVGRTSGMTQRPTPDPAPNFFRGLAWASVLSVPLWALIGVAIWLVIR